MSLKDFVNEHHVVTCSPQATIQEVATIMRDKNVGSVVVCEDNAKPAGVITDRDITIRHVSQGMDSSCIAQTHMSKPVETVSIDAHVHDVIAMMRDKQVRRVVVVDQNGEPQGIVSHGDVIKLMARELNELATGTAPEKEKLMRTEEPFTRAAS